MKISKVEYLAMLMTEKALAIISNFLSENGITCVGDFQHNMHYTLHYYGWKPTADRSDIPVADLGKTVELILDSFGCYTVDGVVQNMGFRVSEECLKEISVGGGTLADISTNQVPHITVAINPATDKEGKVIAKAVNTRECDFTKLLAQPLIIPATLAVFRGNDVAFQVQ